MSVEAKAVIEFETMAKVTSEKLQKYADASGDHNPIHLDENAAKEAGLPGVIAHGMFTAALMGERALRFVEGTKGSWILASLRTRFRTMTFLGDEVKIGGWVRTSTASELVLELTALNQRGEATTTGVARFVEGSLQHESNPLST